MSGEGAAPAKGSIRGFIIRRFIAITAVVVIADALILYAEDRLLSPVLASLMQSAVADASAGEALRWGFRVIFGFFLKNPSSALGASDAIFALMLTLAMLALLATPIVLGALVFSRITERRIAAEQRARDEERRQFYRRRNLMVSDMAHDLRTPVMGISGLAQALEEDMVSDEETQQRYLRSISVKSQKMADLVNILFEYVQLDSEGYTLDRKPLDLPQLLLQEAAAAYSDVEEAGMVLQVEVPETPLSIVADRRQMARVVANLIANAMRHNGAGTTIVLGLERRAGVADIIVADSGAPITQDARNLFEPFAKGDSARSSEGSGLGLSIVKTIVDMHGYQIGFYQPYGIFTKAFIVTCAVED